MRIPLLCQWEDTLYSLVTKCIGFSSGFGDGSHLNLWPKKIPISTFRGLCGHCGFTVGLHHCIVSVQFASKSDVQYSGMVARVAVTGKVFCLGLAVCIQL